MTIPANWLKRTPAFTLIELLIVVAIIGILAAIAVPNFLNAQMRAKSARCFADMKMLYDQIHIRKADTGLWLVDGNDAGPPEKCQFPIPCYYFGVTPRTVAMNTGGLNDEAHFNGCIWAQLTSPIAYMGSIPLDPFGKGLFYGYEDRDCSNTTGSHWLMFATGPDGDHGDWFKNRKATAYQPSNGLTSNGDIWRAVHLRGGGRVDYWSEIGLFDVFF